MSISTENVIQKATPNQKFFTHNYPNNSSFDDNNTFIVLGFTCMEDTIVVVDSEGRIREFPYNESEWFFYD